MKVIGMLFNGEMVTALLAGKKTQTRRPISPNLTSEHEWVGFVIESSNRKQDGCAKWKGVESFLYAKPPCAVGDLIYVRETFRQWNSADECGCEAPCNCPNDGEVIYAADKRKKDTTVKWTPSIHMPRSKSRITLEVTVFRVERITDISRKDALAEGIERWDDTYSITPYRNYLRNAKNKHETLDYSIPEPSFLSLWDLTYQTDSLKENPWVWVIEFNVIRENVDKYLKRSSLISKQA